jgi:hypothetical protein
MNVFDPRLGTQQKRRFERLRPVGLMARTGQLVVGKSLPVISCNIVDIGAGGACLDLDPVQVRSLPQRFELVYAGARKKCRIVWRHGRRAGVCF